MRRALRQGAVLFAIALLVASGRGATAHAQAPSVEYRIFPSADPLPTVPRILISSANIPAVLRPVTLRLQASNTRDFSQSVLDTALVGDTVTIVPNVIFRDADSVYMRFSVRDVLGRDVAEAIAGFRTGPRLRLRRPTGAYGVTEYDLRPTFLWEASAIESPPGPWVFELTVINNITNQEAFRQSDIVETSLRPAVALEANTPYRWQIRSRLGNGPDTTTAFEQSQSTFVIQSADAPTITVLYQNFPNPFPTDVAATTCVWFDLRRRASVQLVLRDLRGNHVRTLIDGVSLSPGSYGKRGEGQNSGCVPGLEWDGTAANGRVVPPGVYLLHFRADGVETVRKILFRGR